MFCRPNYAFLSDPRFMSTIVDSEYSPQFSSDGKGYLGFIPNLYDPVRPLPVNMTPQKLLKMYEILFDDEDAQLYGEQTTTTPPGWFVSALLFQCAVLK